MFLELTIIIGFLLVLGFCIWSLELHDLFNFCVKCKLKRPYLGESFSKGNTPILSSGKIQCFCPICETQMEARRRRGLILLFLFPFRMTGKSLFFIKDILVNIIPKKG
jgi:hypothetical protein